jgi:hypothetical protein
MASRIRAGGTSPCGALPAFPLGGQQATKYGGELDLLFGQSSVRCR